MKSPRVVFSGRALPAVVALAACVLAIPGAALAQSTRTFVAPDGDDAAACTAAAPCKTFSAAIRKTAAAGEINCLAPGSYGPVAISKAITIDCHGVGGHITTNAGGSGVAISVPNDAQVTLRGLTINGGVDSISGVTIVGGGGFLLFDDLRITQMGVDAINVFAPRTMRVTISNSVLSNNIGGGVTARAIDNVALTLSLENVQANHNVYGLRVEDNVTAAVSRSTFNNNRNNGLLAFSRGRVVIARVFESEMSNNGVNGVAAVGAGANVRLSYSSVTGNGNGLNTSEGGSIFTTTPATNAVYGNQAMNDPTGTLPLK